MQSYESQLRMLARRLTGNDADAGDLVQDTWERALDKLSTLDEDANVRAWLMTVMTNRFRDLCRRRRPRVPVPDLPQPEPETPPAWSEITAEQYRAAVAELPDYLREPYVLKTEHKRSYKQIAAALSIAEGTVGSRIVRARDRLAELLGKDR